ncbi:MAG: hypothetical protein J4G15_05925 [Alphaproteobacteria bacterium]|nr:hypothetical protein [Alphaproteobacteria bacterium]
MAGNWDVADNIEEAAVPHAGDYSTEVTGGIDVVDFAGGDDSGDRVDNIILGGSGSDDTTDSEDPSAFTDISGSGDLAAIQDNSTVVMQLSAHNGDLVTPTSMPRTSPSVSPRRRQTRCGPVVRR